MPYTAPERVTDKPALNGELEIARGAYAYADTMLAVRDEDSV